MQERVLLVFRKFFELGSARQTLLWFLEHGLQVPVSSPRDQVAWRRPRCTTIYNMLTNPAYAGAYAYGRTEHSMQYEQGQPRRRRRESMPATAVLVCADSVLDLFKLFPANVALVRRGARAVPEMSVAGHRGSEDPPCWPVCCDVGVGGRKLMVAYTGNGPFVLVVRVSEECIGQRGTACITFAGLSIDEAISRQIMTVLEPAAIEAAVLASEQEKLQQDEIISALKRDLEAARYTARRAETQYDTTDPENRLVVSELERRWNALQKLQQLEARIEQAVRGPAGCPGDQRRVCDPGARLGSSLEPS